MSQRATINGRSSARANVNKRRPGRGEGGGARQETTREGRWGTTRQETTREGRGGGETRQEKSRGGREGEKQGKRRPGGRGEGEVHVVHKEKKKQW